MDIVSEEEEDGSKCIEVEEWWEEKWMTYTWALLELMLERPLKRDVSQEWWGIIENKEGISHWIKIMII